ncbi:MAG TPA: class I SAM-dependent methyltransferase [Vicinamibacterales bacterium]|nr:class I SAM-dependent methyltransferase [Vicinamibacterales bacterium]
MRLLPAAVVVAAAVVSTIGAEPPRMPDRAGRLAPGGLAPEVDAVLRQIKAADAGQLSVSEEDGRFLRVLVAMRRARSILEIGAASGYSAIWLGLGARESGGRVVAIEYDAQRAHEAIRNVRRAGLADVVTIVEGDAFREIPKRPGTFDFVFLDAWKPDYQRFFDLVFPRLEAGGVFVAHNVVNKRGEMEPFLRTIQTHPSLFTSIVSPSAEGMSVSYKKIESEFDSILP